MNIRGVVPGFVRPCIFLVVMAMISALPPAPGVADAAQLVPASERDWAPLTTLAENYVAEQPSIDGAGLIVVHKDEGVIYHEHFGTFTEDRVSMIASSSKMISSGVVMKLDQEGVFDADLPLSQVVDWPGVHPDATAVNLISNSSGLVGLGPDFLYDPYICQFVDDKTLTQCGREVLTTTDDDADVLAPDTEFRYGGAQWQVAGAIAETVSGKSWDQLIDEIYVQPCGLENTGFQNFVSLGSFGDYPVGFQGNPDLHPPSINPSIEGGAYTTTGDYGKLLLMHLRDGECENGQVFTTETLNRMHTSRIDAGGDNGYGMGWWVDKPTKIIEDSGLWGALPWINFEHDYAAYWVIEDTFGVTSAVRDRLRNEIHRIVTGGNQIGRSLGPSIWAGDTTFAMEPREPGATIWYTLDGTDPVGTDGLPTDSALTYSDIADVPPIQSVVTARELATSGWSRRAVLTLYTDTPSVPGDVNCDGSASIVDALMVAQYAVATRSGAPCPLADPATQINIAPGDLNGDTATNITDALLIAQCSVGLDNIYCP